MILPTPAQVTGPYYLPAPMRCRFAEELPGAQLALTFAVRDLYRRPLPARIALWHADAGGVYSGYVNSPDGETRPVDARGKSFLRGEIPTDEDGSATFNTIVPGWYTGRPVHVHFSVFYDNGKKTFTSQLYFKESLLREVSQRQEYIQRGFPETVNEDENVPESLLLDVKPDGKGGYKSRFEVFLDCCGNAI